MQDRAVHVLTDDDTLFQRFTRLSDTWSVLRLQSPDSVDDLPAESLLVADTALASLAEAGMAPWHAWSARLLVIVASSLPSDDEGLRFLDAGASGYCHAYAAEATLRQILDVVASGEKWVGKSLLNRLLAGLQHNRESQTDKRTVLLTEREREVALLAARGQSNLLIAETLQITERTVKAHLSAAFEKLQVSDRLQLALKIHGIQH